MNTNHVGETVGIFEIVELMSYKDSDGQTLYKGICNDCGFERIARYHDLKRTSRCNHIGVAGKFFHKTNWSNSRIKDIFHGMKQRCYNDKDKNYRWYGAKGIKVCNEWLDDPKRFEEWALKNGYNNSLTIDRIDENKDYSPSNCRWISGVQNTKYKSTTSLITVKGETHTGKDWSKILGLGENRINIYVRKYGIDNTTEFIKRYMTNPEFKPHGKTASIYDAYMK